MEVDAIKQIVLDSLRNPHVIDTDDGRKFIALPNGNDSYELETITLPNAAEVLMPKTVVQAVQVHVVDSLVEYVNRFKNFDTAVFANIATNEILAVIDYHKMPPANLPGEDNSHNPSPCLGEHTVNLKLPHSIEWETWSKIDGALMSHVAFATFLEENSIDILPLGKMLDGAGQPVEDAPSTLLELCRELQIKSSYGANSAVRSGDYTNIEFQKGDDVATKKNVALPLSITIQIPVYFGERAVQITAFLRRKVDEGSLKLGIKLMRPENVRQDEFHRIVGGIASAVELTTLYGRPK